MVAILVAHVQVIVDGLHEEVLRAEVAMHDAITRADRCTRVGVELVLRRRVRLNIGGGGGGGERRKEEGRKKE